MKIKLKCPCGAEFFMCDDGNYELFQIKIEEWKSEHEECIDIARSNMEKISNSVVENMKKQITKL